MGTHVYGTNGAVFHPHARKFFQHTGGDDRFGGFGSKFFVLFGGGDVVVGGVVDGLLRGR